VHASKNVGSPASFRRHPSASVVVRSAVEASGQPIGYWRESAAARTMMRASLSVEHGDQPSLTATQVASAPRRRSSTSRERPPAFGPPPASVRVPAVGASHLDFLDDISMKSRRRLPGLFSPARAGTSMKCVSRSTSRREVLEQRAAGNDALHLARTWWVAEIFRCASCGGDRAVRCRIAASCWDDSVHFLRPACEDEAACRPSRR